MSAPTLESFPGLYASIFIDIFSCRSKFREGEDISHLMFHEFKQQHVSYKYRRIKKKKLAYHQNNYLTREHRVFP